MGIKEIAGVAKHALGTSMQSNGPSMRLALYQPDIPQNAGTMVRMAACLGLGVDIVEPAAFDVSDRHFRRSGMDYLERAAVMRHDSFRTFEEWRRAEGRRLVLAETDGATALPDFAFRPSDIVMVGRESAGVTAEVRNAAGASLHNLPEPLLEFRADRAMFERRRQRGIARQEVRLQRNLRSYGLISTPRMIGNIMLRTCFRLLPGPLMRLAYRWLFRRG